MADAPAAGSRAPRNGQELPPETVHAMLIEKNHAKSVVRLRIHQKAPKRAGRGTGFIVVNTTNRLVVMTCGHLFRDMEPRKEVDVTFYDGKEATADAVYIHVGREVALLLIQRSRTSLSPDEISQYAAVNFSSEQNDVRMGEPLVMLGCPYSLRSEHKIGCFLGSVTIEAGLVAKSQGAPVRMFGGDYGSGPGASGAPVFGSDSDGRVVGINISGHQDISFTLSVPWIRDTLMTIEQVRNSKLANPTIKEIIEYCVRTPTRGHAGAGSSSAGGSDAPAEASGSGSAQGPTA